MNRNFCSKRKLNESVLDVKELKLNYLKKHGLVEENVVLI